MRRGLLLTCMCCGILFLQCCGLRKQITTVTNMMANATADGTSTFAEQLLGTVACVTLAAVQTKRTGSPPMDTAELFDCDYTDTVRVKPSDTSSVTIEVPACVCDSVVSALRASFPRLQYGRHVASGSANATIPLERDTIRLCLRPAPTADESASIALCSPDTAYARLRLEELRKWVQRFGSLGMKPRPQQP